MLRKSSGEKIGFKGETKDTRDAISVTKRKDPETPRFSRCFLTRSPCRETRLWDERLKATSVTRPNDLNDQTTQKMELHL